MPSCPSKLRANSAELTWLAKMRDILVLSLGSLVMWRMSCSMGVIPGTGAGGTQLAARPPPPAPVIPGLQPLTVCLSPSPTCLTPAPRLRVENCPSCWFPLLFSCPHGKMEGALALNRLVSHPAPAPPLHPPILLSEEGESGARLSSSVSPCVQQNE